MAAGPRPAGQGRRPRRARATPPSSRSPGPPAAASPRCSTRCRGARGEHARACGGRPPASRTPPSGGRPRTAEPTGCSTGWRCRAGTGTRPSRRWTGWSCSTCPTTTACGSSTGSRSTAWSGWSTSWCGCSTRRSTPTPRCTTATSRRSPGTPACCSSSSTRSTGSTPRPRQACLADLRALLDREGLAATPAARRLGPHRRGRGRAARRAGRAGSPPGGRPPTGSPPTSAARPPRWPRTARRTTPGPAEVGRRRAGEDLVDALAARPACRR